MNGLLSGATKILNDDGTTGPIADNPAALAEASVIIAEAMLNEGSGK
jgi:hypothetical protein